MGDSSSGPHWPVPDDANWQDAMSRERDAFGFPIEPAVPAAGPTVPGAGDGGAGSGGGGAGSGGDGGGPEGPGGPEGSDTGDDEPVRRLGLTRRQALGVLGATGVVGAGLLVGGRRLLTEETASTDTTRPPGTTVPPTAPAPTDTAPPAAAPPEGARWSDPATWGGTVPGEGDVAEVTQHVVLDVDTKVAGVHVHPGARLSWDPNAGHELQSTGNVVVHGTLQMRPANPAVQHVLTFADVDEEAFTGGHTEEPMAEDVGLWVLHDGVADLAGAPKTPWTRLTGGADKGATTITVQEAEGWQVGDEIVIAPTEPATVDEFWLHNDRTTITAISGTTVTLAEPLAHPHPVVTVREGVTHTAEVLNLTRNVRLQGTPEGRAHVMFLHCNQPQDLSYLAIRHMGPRQGGAGDGDEDNPSAGVEGRYGLHFHMCGDGTRGSKVTGVTVADTGNHAFVPHLSHGMTFERCVSHDTRDDAFWWDPAGEYDDPDTVPTHNVVYDRCVASTVLLPEEGQGPAAFFMGVGKDNVARGCVAFGSTGHGESAAAFHWPERSRSEHDAWIFEDCLAHNCQQSGIYYWQNEVPRTNVDRFTAYQNRWGIWAGAYANDVSYRECTIYRNLEGGLEVQAASADEGPVYEDLYVDQGGLSDFACVFHGPIAGGDAITTVSGCTFKGGKKAQVTIQNGPGPDSDNGDLTGQNYEFVDCTFEGNAFWLEEGVRENAHIKVSDSRHGTLMLHKKGSGGTPKPEWNATATPA